MPTSLLGCILQDSQDCPAPTTTGTHQVTGANVSTRLQQVFHHCQVAVVRGTNQGCLTHLRSSSSSSGSSSGSSNGSSNGSSKRVVRLGVAPAYQVDELP